MRENNKNPKHKQRRKMPVKFLLHGVYMTEHHHFPFNATHFFVCFAFAKVFGLCGKALGCGVGGGLIGVVSVRKAWKMLHFLSVYSETFLY